MVAEDPLPMDAEPVSPSTFMSELVLRWDVAPFLLATMGRGRRLHVGNDMLVEQIAGRHEFLGNGTRSTDDWRALSPVRD